MNIGAHYASDGSCTFSVWAPFQKELSLRVIHPQEKNVRLEKDEIGYWRITMDALSAGTKYFYRIDGLKERPDPASCYQPEGVHGASETVDHREFQWGDDTWKGVPLREMIIYELHIGTFTPQGTFEAIVPRLDELNDMGINAIEIMPVAQFPGTRNWGYDGVFTFAVQHSYGGPYGLKVLVNECHKRDIAVILDVVYNHFGPEGNYLRDFGPYFTNKYQTPWGEALNFDGPYSNEVRKFFVENALYWFDLYHIDALRLDAIHAIYDRSAYTFIQELSERVAEFSVQQKRKYYLIAESDLNDSRIVRDRDSGGIGFDAQWCDDFHHSLRTLMTEEKQGYYIDYGKTRDLVTSLNEGYVYSGQYSRYRKMNHGTSSRDIPAERFIVFAQNHDQIGNRMTGERLSSSVSIEFLKVAAGVVLLSPYIPLLFMGEEYGETTPFLYFVDHSDQHLIQAVREGRKAEFRSFRWDAEPPDPFNTETFAQSKIEWNKRYKGHYYTLLKFYKELIRFRKGIPVLSCHDHARMEVWGEEGNKFISMRRWGRDERMQVYMGINFHNEDYHGTARVPGGTWKKYLESSDIQWGGEGGLLSAEIDKEKGIHLRAHSFGLYVKED